MLTFAVAAQPGDVLPLRGVIEISETRVIELQVGAANLSERFNLVGVDLPEVAPMLESEGTSTAAGSDMTSRLPIGCSPAIGALVLGGDPGALGVVRSLGRHYTSED
jgi:hypothetical protein